MAAQRQDIQVIDPIPILDTGVFEHLQRVASVMANSSLIPDALRVSKVVDEEGNTVYENRKPLMETLPHHVILANCFLVVNQAVRWGLDPFAVAQCVSVVSGKLCYEGKLVAGVLDAKLGIRLDYVWDDKPGDQLGIVVSGVIDGVVKTVEGTVGGWKTSRKGSPWASPANHKRMLAYRGAREWARIHKPSIMLGVYTDDEMTDLQSEGRTSQLRGIAPVQDPLGKPPEVVQRIAHDPETGEIKEASPVGDKVDSPPADTEAEAKEVQASPTGHTTEPSSPAPPAEESATDNPEAAGTAPGQQPPEAAAAPPEPTDEESYKAHVFWWVGHEAKSREEASKRWKSEMQLRIKLQVPGETVEACKRLIESTFPKEQATHG